MKKVLDTDRCIILPYFMALAEGDAAYTVHPHMHQAPAHLLESLGLKDKEDAVVFLGKGVYDYLIEVVFDTTSFPNIYHMSR